MTDRAGDDGAGGEQLLRALARWQDSGGAWRVLDRRPDAITVALLRCDGGEEVDRIASGHGDWLRYLADRDSNED